MDDRMWVLLAVLGTLTAYFAYGWKFRKSFKTMEEFFNYGRRLPPKLFSDTFIATNVTFASIYLVISATTYQRGNITLWIIISWVVGLFLFRLVFPKISSFFNKGHTLPEFLGIHYADQSLRKLASICTVLAFLGTLGIEFWGVVLLLESLGLRHVLATGTIAILVALITGTYTALGGFKAAVHTDRWQRWLVLALTASMLLVIFNFYGLLPHIDTKSRAELLHRFVAPSTLLSDWLFIIAMFVLFVPFNFCVMDMWQRCTATPSNQRISAIRSVGSYKTVLTFVVVLSIPVLVGLAAQIALPQDDKRDPLLILPAILEQISGPQCLRVPMLCIIYAGLIAALLSTADTLLINVVYTFLYDILGPFRRIDYSKLSATQQEHAIWIFRFWIYVCVFLALPLIGIGFSMYELVFAVFSSQVVLFLPILYAIIKPGAAVLRNRGAWWGILLGFGSAVLVVTIGRLTGARDLVDGAPVFAFLISVILFFAFPRQQGRLGGASTMGNRI